MCNKNAAFTVLLKKEYRVVGEIWNHILYWEILKYENLGFSRKLHGVY